MIAAEEPTDIVINGSAGTPCALSIEFGDGTRQKSTIGDATPFPLKIAHTYPKTGGVTVRVSGAADGGLPACEGQADVAVHVSPAGSKIEFITLSTGCPEGWKLVGTIGDDKSFSCTPIPDTSAPTNLIHCIDGMRYFAQAGRIGCRHPAAPPVPEEKFAKSKTPTGKAAGAAETSTSRNPLAKTPGGQALKPGKKSATGAKPAGAAKPADGVAPKSTKPTTPKPATPATKSATTPATKAAKSSP